MVKLCSGIESPVDMAFNDIFEVIQEIEMPNAAQIVPGRDADTANILYKSSNRVGEVQIYDNDLGDAPGVKTESKDDKLQCTHPNQFSEWLNISINADKTPENSDHLFQQDFTSIRYIEDLEWGEKLVSETKNLFELPGSYKSYTDISLGAQVDQRLVPEFEQPFTEDFFLDADYEPAEDCQDDSYFSENSSDSESTKKDYDGRILIGRTPRIKSIVVNSSKTEERTAGRPEIKRQSAVKKCPKSFKSSGRPRLCQFLLELLNHPEKYSNLIEWLDKDKGVFKFLNSSRVAQEWGTRRNKPKMKYENFARSLRTYIAKGILTKPRSKLVYRFSSL